MTIRIVLADDQPVVLSGIRVMLDLADDLCVVGEASDGREAVDVVRRTRPDVVIMDVRMPNMDGIEASRVIADDPHLNGVRVIVLTTFEIDEYVFGALAPERAGSSSRTSTPPISKRPCAPSPREIAFSIR